jgi:hypothetical protein
MTAHASALRDVWLCSATSEPLNNHVLKLKSTALIAIFLATRGLASVSPELRVGDAGHAFDHLGNIGEQAEAAAASGANILYVTGLGGLGYNGLPGPDEMVRQHEHTRAYIQQAKAKGVRLAIGYVCATSIVKLETFDRNWPPDLRAQFHSPPSAWRQQARNGSVLPSWYGGDYQPACMNNPDWRAYERFIIRQQLDSGCDGIFFDNPTVHPQGCYCDFCMKKFGDFLKHEGMASTNSIAGLRDLSTRHPTDFLRFRCAIARDFLNEMRVYARKVKRDALVTANNSLNSSDALFSQCRSYAYNIYEMSQAEDFVVVEDMATQPRKLADGRTIEYGPTYELLHAISHGKPVVAVTLAEADYHTAPSLARLAMAEAAAHRASYLSWPTWPEKERQRMAAAIRPQSDFLRRNAAFLNEVEPRRDLLLFLPFRKWAVTNVCAVSAIAAKLTRENVQYGILSEDNFTARMLKTAIERGTKTLIIESRSDLSPHERSAVEAFAAAEGKIVEADHPNWFREAEHGIGQPSLELDGPKTLRAVVYDQPKRVIIHLLNLNVQRRSSFEDHVEPATNVVVTCRVPLKQVSSVEALSADKAPSSESLKFRTRTTDAGLFVQAKVPRIETSTILVIDP